MRSTAAASAGMPAARPARAWYFLGPPNASLIEALAPSITTLQKVLVTAVFIGLIAAFAHMKFYLPQNPVPVSLSTFGVLLAGGVLGWRWGGAAVLGYYLAGAAGAPVFVEGGGWTYVTGSVTGGYLIGFLLAAPLVGYLAQRGWHRGRILWPMLAGALAVYVPALIWLSVFDFGWPATGQLFTAAVYPFIPGDLVKLMLAALVVGVGWRYADLRGR